MKDEIVNQFIGDFNIRKYLTENFITNVISAKYVDEFSNRSGIVKEIASILLEKNAVDKDFIKQVIKEVVARYIVQDIYNEVLREILIEFDEDYKNRLNETNK